MLNKLEFKKSFVLVWLAAFVTTFLFAVGCSVLKVQRPAPRTLVLPEKGTGTGFGLSGETPAGLFRGALLIWSPEVKPQQIETLLRTARDTNEKYVALNRYFSQFQENEVLPLKRAVEDRRSQFVRAQMESNERSAAAQSQKASAWITMELEDIKQKFPIFDAGRSEVLFQAYCQAKIIDLATRPFLVREKLTSRPTPSALCESYYQGRFFTGESCANDTAGRQYYECVWNEGVLKTKFAERLAVKVAPTATGTKTSSVLSLAEFASLPQVKNALGLKTVEYCTSELMRNKILSGVKYRILANGNITGGFVCGEKSRFEISYGPGEWDKELTTSSAGFLISAIENQVAFDSLAPSFQWLDPLVAQTSAELSARVQASAVKIAAFHASATGCSGEFNSPNDVYFNDPRLVQGVSLQGNCKGVLPSRDHLPDVLVVDELLESQRAELNSLESQLINLKGQSCPVYPSCDAVAAGHARCDYMNAQVRKAAAAEARGVTRVLVTDFALSFERVTPTTSTVVVWMNNGPVGIGCLGEAKSGACSGAVIDPALSSAAPLLAEVSPFGELSLKLKIETQQLSAAGVPESLVKQFNSLNGKNLELNASLNRFDGLVPYLSGKAYVRENESASSSVVAEGSVSYLIENTFDRALGKFCSAGL